MAKTWFLVSCKLSLMSLTHLITSDTFPAFLLRVSRTELGLDRPQEGFYTLQMILNCPHVHTRVHSQTQTLTSTQAHQKSVSLLILWDLIALFLPRHTALRIIPNTYSRKSLRRSNMVPPTLHTCTFTGKYEFDERMKYAGG